MVAGSELLSRLLRPGILDVLTEAEDLENSRRDCVLHLGEEDVQKIAAAVGTPEAFAEGNGSEGAHAPLLIFKRRISELRTFAVTRKQIAN